MKTIRSTQKTIGFTMVEVLGVVAAMAVISSIGFVAVTNTKKAADATKLEQDAESLNRSIQVYMSSGGDLTGVTTTDALLAKLKTPGGSAKTLGITSSVIDARIWADSGDGTSRLRAVFTPSSNPVIPPRFTIGQGTTGVVEFRMDDNLAANPTAANADSRSGTKNLASSGGWVWDKSQPPTETAVDQGYTPGTAGSVNASLAALLSHPNLIGGVFLVPPGGGAVTTDNKYYDGAGYQGELGIFSLEGMGNPPYDLTTAAGILAFNREAVRRVAEGGTNGGVAMSRDGTGHTVTFNPGTAVAFILIPNATFASAETFLAGSNPSNTSSTYPLTSLSYDTGNVAGFSQSQAVSLGKNAFAIEDLAPGSADNDYEDIVWKTTGITQPDWSTMRQVDPATYYSNWDNPTTTTVEHENILNRTGDVLLNGTDPTLGTVFRNLGLIP